MRKAGQEKKLVQHYSLTNPSYALIGIVSYLKGNNIAMVFNKDFGFNFQQSPDILFLRKDQSAFSFPVFWYEDENNTTLFRLITNRTADGIFAKEFKEFDYLIQIEGDYAENFANELLTSLKRNKGVLASGKLPLQRLKRKLLS